MHEQLSIVTKESNCKAWIFRRRNYQMRLHHLHDLGDDVVLLPDSSCCLKSGCGAAKSSYELSVYGQEYEFQSDRRRVQTFRAPSLSSTG